MANCLPGSAFIQHDNIYLSQADNLHIFVTFAALYNIFT